MVSNIGDVDHPEMSGRGVPPTHVEVVDGTARVRPKGDLDAPRIPELRRDLDSVIGDPAVTMIVLDLADIRFVDSTGLGALIAIQANARAANSDLRLRNPRSQLLRLMAVTQTYSTFSWG